MMRLTEANSGAEVMLIHIEGGKCVRSRLFNMGLTPGLRLKVISKNPCGPVVLKVRNSKLALGRGMAEKILVR